MAPRRKSTPKASPAKSLSGDPVVVEEYAKAWDTVTSAIDSLKSSGQWVSSGTAPGTVPGLTNVLPNDFKGRDVPVDTPNLSSNSSCRLAVWSLHCVGVLGDLELQTPGFAAMSISRSDIAGAREYWYGGSSEPRELPMLTVLYTDETEKGGFHPVTRLAMIAAFIVEWASATTDSRREQFKKLAGAITMRLLKGAGDSADCFWQVHAFGEDAEKIAQEESNAYCILQSLLKSVGKRHTAEDIFQEFQAKVADGKLRYASEESKAGVWETMREMQRSTEGPTWMSKWATAVRVLGPSKDPQDFAYMIRQLAKGFHCPEEVKDSFVKPVGQMTRDQVESTCKALLATRRIMARVAKECGGDPAAGQDKSWTDALSKMLLPDAVPVTKVDGSHVSDAFLGKSDSQVAVLQLLQDLNDLKHLKVVQAVSGYVDNASSQWSDSRVQAIVREAVAESPGSNSSSKGTSQTSCLPHSLLPRYGKEFLRPTAVTEPEPAPAPVPDEGPPAWNDGDMIEPPATPGSVDPGAMHKQLRNEVDREARRHVKYLVVNDVLDSNGVATTLTPSLGNGSLLPRLFVSALRP
ncbi:Cacna2d3 [Symbiodinium sp. CCMP2592]|nr:Cacna2d3 [Symbiodinium sp. CCMP2592]CAE7436671.1 Cacna2d3 [Symbiodinium sp. CCMP2592]